jgi:hypothetical protein
MYGLRQVLGLVEQFLLSRASIYTLPDDREHSSANQTSAACEFRAGHHREMAPLPASDGSWTRTAEGWLSDMWSDLGSTERMSAGALVPTDPVAQPPCYQLLNSTQHIAVIAGAGDSSSTRRRRRFGLLQDGLLSVTFRVIRISASQPVVQVCDQF